MSYKPTLPPSQAALAAKRRAGLRCEAFEASQAAAFHWRDRLPVHSAAEAFPLLSEKGLKELAGDIKRNGLQTSIVIWSPEANAEPQLLDGRNRLDALALIGQLAVDEQGRLCIRKTDGTLEPIDQQHIVGGDPEKLAYSLNVHRRHLSPELKRDLIAQLLKKQPEASDRQIGKQIKADNKTVAAVRSDLERREEIPHVKVRTDAKGRNQPARKQRKTAKPKRNTSRDQRELEKAQAHIAEIEATCEQDKDLGERLRAAEIKIVGLDTSLIAGVIELSHLRVGQTAIRLRDPLGKCMNIGAGSLQHAQAARVPCMALRRARCPRWCMMGLPSCPIQTSKRLPHILRISTDRLPVLPDLKSQSSPRQ